MQETGLAQLTPEMFVKAEEAMSLPAMFGLLIMGGVQQLTGEMRLLIGWERWGDFISVLGQ